MIINKIYEYQYDTLSIPVIIAIMSLWIINIITIDRGCFKIINIVVDINVIIIIFVIQRIV